MRKLELASRTLDMNVPRSPSQLAPWQRWHYECLAAEVELLRRENRSLRQNIDSWHDGRKQALLHLENLRRAVTALPGSTDEQHSPLECAKTASPLSLIATEKLYKLYEAR